MTPDERVQLDAYAMTQHGMDSEDVDEALTRVGGDAATLQMARAAVTAYALRRDMLAGRVYRDVIPTARAVIAAWRAPVAPTPDAAADHMRRLADALGELEQALQANPSDSQPSACCVWLKFTQHSSFESSVCYVPLHRLSSVKLTVNTRLSDQGHRVGRAWVMTADDGYLLDDHQTARLLEILDEGALSLDALPQETTP